MSIILIFVYLEGILLSKLGNYGCILVNIQVESINTSVKSLS